jgi:myosin heavy subunit
LQFVDAQERADISELKKQLVDLKKELAIKKIDIDNQKRHIVLQENILEEKQIYEKQLRQTKDKSWSDMKKYDDSLQAVYDARKELEKRESDLQNMINEYNDIESQIQQVQEGIKSFDDEYLLQKRQYLSGLAKHVGVYLSDSCITMIKNNISSSCPTYEDLVNLDTSSKAASGDFVKTDGFFHREKSKYQNSHRFYDSDDVFRIIIDPQSNEMTRMKTVEIRPNFDTYVLETNMIEYDDINTYLIVYHDRYIEGCKKAVINADKWQMLLPDTIHHLRNECTLESTMYVEKELIPQEKTFQDITTSRDYLHKQWLSFVKEFCIFKYKSC